MDQDPYQQIQTRKQSLVEKLVLVCCALLVLFGCAAFVYVCFFDFFDPSKRTLNRYGDKLYEINGHVFLMTRPDGGPSMTNIARYDVLLDGRLIVGWCDGLPYGSNQEREPPSYFVFDTRHDNLEKNLTLADFQSACQRFSVTPRDKSEWKSFR